MPIFICKNRWSGDFGSPILFLRQPAVADENTHAWWIMTPSPQSVLRCRWKGSTRGNRAGQRWASLLWPYYITGVLHCSWTWRQLLSEVTPFLKCAKNEHTEAYLSILCADFVSSWKLSERQHCAVCVSYPAVVRKGSSNRRSELGEVINSFSHISVLCTHS